MRTAANVQQTSSTTGTGNLTLAAAATGYRGFLDAFVEQGGSDYHLISYYAENADGSEWEFGAAQIIDDAANGQLDRAGGVVFESSNADALVNFTGDTTIRCVTPPAMHQFDRGAKCTRAGAGQSIPATSWAYIEWDTATPNTDGTWSGSFPSTLNVPLWADLVEVEVHIEFGSTAEPRFHISLSGFDANAWHYLPAIDNGGTWYASAKFVAKRDTTQQYPTVQLRVYNPDGVAVSFGGAGNSWLRVRFVG